MNIIARPYGSSLCYCRPDTTWERESKDFYSPECVSEIHWAPILFVRISKAGKCIGKKFASRYYDAFNFGILLYCHTEECGDLAFTSCADHTSLLPFPLYNMVVLGNEGNRFTVRKDDKEIFSMEGECIDLIEDTLCRASMLTTLRIGDIVAIELKEKARLAERTEGEVALQATYCDNELFCNKIIF